MALWQYTFFVLPVSGVEKDLNNFRFAKNNDSFDDDSFWEGLSVNNTLFERVSTFLPKGKAWSEDLLVFGDLASNCLKVFSEKGIVVSVSLRIDFTSKYEDLLNELIEFFILNGLLLIDEDLNVVPLNYLEIKKRIEASLVFEKYRFFSER